MPRCEACEERKKRAAMRSFKWVRRGAIAGGTLLLLSFPITAAYAGWRNAKRIEEVSKRDEMARFLRAPMSFGGNQWLGTNPHLNEYADGGRPARSSWGTEESYVTDAGALGWRSCYVREVQR
jgi:hypothetical protein